MSFYNFTDVKNNDEYIAFILWNIHERTMPAFFESKVDPFPFFYQIASLSGA